MTEEERQNEKHLAIDNYEKAYKERATCEARVSRIFQDLEQIMDLHRQGSLVSNQGETLAQRRIGDGIPTVKAVKYPSLADVAEALRGLESAKEREGAAKQQARSAGVNLDALRNI